MTSESLESLQIWGSNRNVGEVTSREEHSFSASQFTMCTPKFDLFTCGHVEKSNHGVSDGSSAREKGSTHHLKYERAHTVCSVCKMYGTEPPEDIHVCLQPKHLVDHAARPIRGRTLASAVTEFVSRICGSVGR